MRAGHLLRSMQQTKTPSLQTTLSLMQSSRSSVCSGTESPSPSKLFTAFQAGLSTPCRSRLFVYLGGVPMGANRWLYSINVRGQVGPLLSAILCVLGTVPKGANRWVFSIVF